MSHSKGVINSGQQLVYLSEWFAEMSEMQTQDFMTHLVHKYSHKQSDNALINGFNGLGVSDRPASIFQCRMKLLDEWFAQWSDEEKAELLIRLRNINSKFMDEFQTNLESNASNSHNHSQTTDALTDDYQCQQINGNIDDDRKSTEQLAMNGINGHESDEPLVDIECNTDPIEAEVESNESKALNTCEASVVEVKVEEPIEPTTDETLNNVVNESLTEVQEVCG